MNVNRGVFQRLGSAYLLIEGMVGVGFMPAVANAQGWTEYMERTYRYCLAKHGSTKGDVGSQCDVEQASRVRLPLEVVEYCSKYYIR